MKVTKHKRLMMFVILICLMLSSATFTFAQDITMLICGNEFLSELAQSDADQQFSILLASGDAIELQVFPKTGEGFLPSVEFLDLNGKVLAQSERREWNSGHINLYVAPLSGEYRIRVFSEQEVGAFALEVGCILQDGTVINSGTVPRETRPSSTSTPEAVASTPLVLISDEDSLTLFAEQETNLTDLRFEVVVNGQVRSYELAQFFQALILTSGIADEGSCFVLLPNDRNPPLASVCADRSRVFRTPVAGADHFWYDSLGGIVQQIAVYQAEKRVEVCTFSTAECVFNWETAAAVLVDTPVTPTTPTLSTPTVTPTPAYLCLGTIRTNTGASVKPVKPIPQQRATSYDDSMSPGDRVKILSPVTFQDQTNWYQIRYVTGSGTEREGWIDVQYVNPINCP